MLDIVNIYLEKVKQGRLIMNKSNRILILDLLFGIAAVALYSYGDITGGNMMTAPVIVLSVYYVMRKTMLKDKPKKDEIGF